MLCTCVGFAHALHNVPCTIILQSIIVDKIVITHVQTHHNPTPKIAVVHDTSRTSALTASHSLVGQHNGSLLIHMVSQHLPQGKVEHMSESVVGHNLCTPVVVHLDSHRVAHSKVAAAAAGGGVCDMEHVAGSHLAVCDVQAVA